MKNIPLSFIAGCVIAVFVYSISFTIVSASVFIRLLVSFICIVCTVGAVLIAELVVKKLPLVLQIVKFGIVGVLNTVVDVGVLQIFMYATDISFGPWFSVFKGISFLIAVANSFLWNALWTFGTKVAMDRTMARFFVVSVIGFVLNIGIASVLVNILGAPVGIDAKTWALVAALVASVSNMVWNFVGYKVFVFITSKK